MNWAEPSGQRARRVETRLEFWSSRSRVGTSASCLPMGAAGFVPQKWSAIRATSRFTSEQHASNQSFPSSRFFRPVTLGAVTSSQQNRKCDRDAAEKDQH